MMNERIKELEAQCWEATKYGPPWFNSQKFAELIVRECAEVSEDDITDGDACCTNTADRIARQIKKHFGVEE
jgi:hypothetical protein